MHHRLLYFIGRRPGRGVADVLKDMKVSKQYVHRPLAHLVQRGLVTVLRDPQDRRVKRLALSARGRQLERQLSGIQRRRFSRVFAESGVAAKHAWFRVMALLADARFD